jgi:hypothetical protein
MQTPHFRPQLLGLVWLSLIWPLGVSAADTPARCEAQSSGRLPLLVELYTSEGCDSCPPADRWLSSLKHRPDLVALAFHVDYWDRLGWADRFASPVHTQRQAQQQRSNGARFSYTPQLVVDGRDQPGWRSLSLPSPDARTAIAASTVQLKLVREGPRYSAQVVPGSGAPARLAAYWAVTEDGHVTTVKSGENRGATLTHDFVVREYLPVAAWAVKAGTPTSLQYTPTTAADPQHPRQLNLVLVDADTGRPVQALKIGC